MAQRPLEHAEQELLDLIRQLTAETGTVERNRLTVQGRGRGLEVARPLARLKTLGLVDEYDFRPSLLRWLFGARKATLISLAEAAKQPEPEVITLPEPAALAAFTPEAMPPLEEAIPAPLLPASALEPQFEAAPPLTVHPESLTAAAPAPLVEDKAAEPVAAPELIAPQEEPAEELPLAVAPLGAELAGDVPVQSEESGVAPVAEEEPVSEAAAALIAEPVAEAPVAPVEPAPEAVAAPEAAPEALPEAVPAAEAAPAPAPARERPRPLPKGYTDELGGQPIAYQPAPARAALDPDMLENMREMLAGIGMEMTMAGEVLAADRMARGASAGEALMQVILFAFGHAASFDIHSDNPAASEELQDYAAAVLTELARLRDAGEIDADFYDHDEAHILALTNSAEDRSALVAKVFADPVGGSAPPALLPEELRGISEEDEGEEG